jgi:hypothetical protein
MQRMTLYLRATLFAPPGATPHVPAGALILVGNADEGGSGGVTLRLEQAFDEKGRPLPTTPVRLIVPWAKIDHVLLHEG